MAWGRLSRRLFERLPDGSYVCSRHGSTVWIRCVDHNGDHLEHVDGDGRGQVHRYRLVPIPPAPGD
jgi:hypothetical protein